MSWRDIAGSQDGVITRTQLRAAGLSNATISRMGRDGQLTSVAPGGFLVGGAPLTYRARLWSAVLATQGLLGFATAAQLWGVDEGEAGSAPVRIHVVVPHARRVYPPQWVRTHRVPVASHAITSVSGLPATSRSWTVLDHLPTLPRGERSRLADRALQRGWIRIADIGRRLYEFPGRAGNTALRELAVQLRDGAAAESERRLHRLLRRAGLTGWVPNYPLWSHGELVAVLDVAIPGKRIALEVDGWAYHSDVDRFRRDRARQNELMMLGWTVLRFTWADLAERPEYVRGLVSRAVA